MKKSNPPTPCSIFVIVITMSSLTFLPGQSQIDQESCDYKEAHCGDLHDNPIEIVPNFRNKRTIELIEMFGYPAENHVVTTEDGYILTAQRIPYSNTARPSTRKIPVLCMHGGFSSSAQWFWQPPQRALVFMLVDAGYDVWIPNSRGTSYSQSHLFLPVNDPTDLRYWDFSTHEMAKYDDPAFINYITNHTGHRRIYWIGHSTGAGQFFSAMSLRPELNSKIRTMFAMAPYAYAGNLTNTLLRAVSPFYANYQFQAVLNQVGTGRLIPEPVAELLVPITETCRESWVDCNLCGSFLYLAVGYSCQLNFTTLPGTLAHFPDVSSVKTMSHSMQFVRSGKFREYDYGTRLNMRHYGRPTPPDYDWSKVNVPIVIYHSDGDNLVVPKDIQKTAAALGENVKEVNLVSYSSFRHTDFIIGIDADKLVYQKIIDTMNSRKYDLRVPV